MLKRIIKMLMASGAGLGVTLITQLLLPPIFLHSYGVADYGEWLVLSATISYLSSLNFGITSYASNELTMLAQRGDLQNYRRLQGSTLALLLGVVAIGAALVIGVALLPLNTLLHLKSIGRTEAGLVAGFLGLQILIALIAGYYIGLFMVVQQSHRGSIWYAVYRLGITTIAAILAWFHSSFATIAISQCSTVLIVTLAIVADLRRRTGGLPLGLRGADWATAKSALKPSGMFGLIFMQNFLVFQAPLILLQRLLGPEIVVLFSISRTILGMARQLLSTITTAIAPEITFSFGRGDRKKLLDIFHYSERVVFFLIPVANLGAFLFSPFLLTVWLGKPSLFETYTYALMTLISAAMSMREHKQYFQFSTNTHHRLAMIVFWGNVAMIGTGIPATLWLGLHGFMYVWLISESTQMALLYLENKKLFNGDPSIALRPVLKLVLFVGASLPLCILIVHYGHGVSTFFSAALAAGATVALAGASYFVFGLNVVQTRILSSTSR